MKFTQRERLLLDALWRTLLGHTPQEEGFQLIAKSREYQSEAVSAGNLWVHKKSLAQTMWKAEKSSCLSATLVSFSLNLLSLNKSALYIWTGGTHLIHWINIVKIYQVPGTVPNPVIANMNEMCSLTPWDLQPCWKR